MKGGRLTKRSWVHRRIRLEGIRFGRLPSASRYGGIRDRVGYTSRHWWRWMPSFVAEKPPFRAPASHPAAWATAVDLTILQRVVTKK